MWKTFSSLNKIEDAKKLQACQTIKIPFTTPQPAPGRVVGAPSHGPESAHKSDDDLLSNAKIVNIRYARKEAKTKTTNSCSMGA